MPFEGGVDDGRAGMPSEARADKVGQVVAMESVSRVELLDRGVDGSTVVTVARASAEDEGYGTPVFH